MLGFGGFAGLAAQNSRLPGTLLPVSRGNVNRPVFSCAFTGVVGGDYLALKQGGARFTLMGCP